MLFKLGRQGGLHSILLHICCVPSVVQDIGHCIRDDQNSKIDKTPDLTRSNKTSPQVLYKSARSAEQT